MVAHGMKEKDYFIKKIKKEKGCLLRKLVRNEYSIISHTRQTTVTLQVSLEIGGHHRNMLLTYAFLARFTTASQHSVLLRAELCKLPRNTNSHAPITSIGDVANHSNNNTSRRAWRVCPGGGVSFFWIPR